MNQKILEDVTKECPCTDKWCFLRELMRSSGFSDRMAEQVRLMYDYRNMTSREEGKDIGDKRMHDEFIEKYGKKFAEAYKDGMKRRELFPLVFGIDFPGE